MGITLTQTQLIPTNVVEVGNELSQNVLNGLAASGISSQNPAVTNWYLSDKMPKPTKQGTATSFSQGDPSFTAQYNGEILISTPYGQFYIPAR